MKHVVGLSVSLLLVPLVQPAPTLLPALLLLPLLPHSRHKSVGKPGVVRLLPVVGRLLPLEFVLRFVVRVVLVTQVHANVAVVPNVK